MADFSTRTARSRLPASSLSWLRLARGRALGYRRSSTPGLPGSWWVRLYVSGRYRKSSLGEADDVQDANGKDILDHGQAVERALAWFPGDDATNKAKTNARFTVREAVERYLEWSFAHRKDPIKAREIFRREVLSKLGDTPVDALTTRQVQQWHQAIADRRSIYMARKYPDQPMSDEERRARKNSANLALVYLKAALNRAVSDGIVEPGAWRRVRAFRGVVKARVRYLSLEEAQKLLEVCDGAFLVLVRAALHTGARCGELRSLRVADYLEESQSIHFVKTKTSTPRHVYLTDDGARFFAALCRGRSPGELMLRNAKGKRWRRWQPQALMRDACLRANIEPRAVFHELRHTYASHYLMNGGSLFALSKQLGHTSTKMVEQHYGHLAASWRAEQARHHAPRFEAPLRLVEAGRE